MNLGMLILDAVHGSKHGGKTFTELLRIVIIRELLLTKHEYKEVKTLCNSRICVNVAPLRNIAP